MVVVPRSMAMPWIGPVERSDFLAVDQDAVAVAGHGGVRRRSPRAAGRSERVPLDAHAAAAHGVAADLSLRPTTRAWQERRKLPRRWRSASVRAVRDSMPSAISTMHSLHLPCFWQEVGTWMPRAAGGVEERRPGGGLRGLSVDGDG